MTILSLIDPESKTPLLELPFNLDALAQEAQENLQVNIAHFFPPVALSRDWHTQALVDALRAVENLLQGQKRFYRPGEALTLKAEDELSEKEKELLKHIPHSAGITIYGKAHVSFRMPSEKEDPALDALIAEFQSLLAFVEKGHSLGALLHNSDYPEEPEEPAQSTAATVDVPIAMSATPEDAKVEEGIPEEALAPVVGEGE